MRPPPILVTGANGQVGRATARLAEARGQAVVALDRRELDVAQADAVRRVIRRERPVAVINAAAYTAVDRAEAEKEAARAVNAEAVGHLAAACKEADIPLLHLSTDFVFDGRADRPYQEEDPVNPLSVYGDTKLEGEEALRSGLRQHVIFRTSWVFAPGHSNFVTTIARLARERDSLHVVDDQWGSPTPAGALAKALLNTLRLIERGEEVWGTYHVAGSPPASRFELAEAVVKELQKGGDAQRVVLEPVPSTAFPTPAQRPRYAALDTERARTKLGIEPIDWREKLGEAVKKKAE